MRTVLPTIGLRNIKTAISVFICILLFQIIGRENPFYACIAAVICMGTSIDSSVTTGKNRFIGTFIGGIWGIILISFFKFIPEWLDPIYIGIGITILIYICNILKLNASISISCVVFLSIMTTTREVSSTVYAINRIIDTSIGIIISILVNKYFNFQLLKHEDSNLKK